MKSMSIYCIILFSFLMMTSQSCEKDPVIPNEEELITTLRYTLTPSGGGQEIVFSFRDIDGDGGAAPVIQVDTLSNLSIYAGEIELLNESISPAENITAEIEDEKVDHQFFYMVTGNNSTITYTDLDTFGFPVGLKTSLFSGPAGQGTLTIVLRHRPDKIAAGVSDGNIMNAGGDTDIEVSFPLIIQ